MLKLLPLLLALLAASFAAMPVYAGAEVEVVVSVTIGSDVFTTNGIVHTLDVPAQLIARRTMVPIRLPLESVGFEVSLEESSFTRGGRRHVWRSLNLQGRAVQFNGVNAISSGFAGTSTGDVRLALSNAPGQETKRAGFLSSHLVRIILC